MNKKRLMFVTWIISLLIFIALILYVVLVDPNPELWFQVLLFIMLLLFNITFGYYMTWRKS